MVVINPQCACARELFEFVCSMSGNSRSRRLLQFKGKGGLSTTGEARSY